MEQSERKSFIMRECKSHYNEAKSLGHEVLAVIVQGSQNYGLDIYTKEYRSDIDTKAIILPTFDDFCKNKQPLSTTHVRDNNEHIDLKDIRIMFETFRKQNVNFVEILFSEYYFVEDHYRNYWTKLRSLGEELTHCHPSQTVRTMSGMSMEKKKALCHPYPTIKDKIDKYGYDGKQLHHIVRINEFIKNYINGIPFSECLKLHDSSTLDIMMKAKLNKYSLSEALEMSEYYDNETNKIKSEFIERNGDKINVSAYEKLDELKIEILRDYFRRQLI